jgi:hypothetical protein
MAVAIIEYTPAGVLCDNITPAIIYDKPSLSVTRAKAGVQCDSGCRIESDMTTIDLFTCRSNKINQEVEDGPF